MSSLRDIFDDVSADLERIWTGMSLPRDMRQAVDKGFMVLLGKETPRVVGWYKFGYPD